MEGMSWVQVNGSGNSGPYPESYGAGSPAIN